MFVHFSTNGFVSMMAILIILVTVTTTAHAFVVPSSSSSSNHILQGRSSCTTTTTVIPSFLTTTKTRRGQRGILVLAVAAHPSTRSLNSDGDLDNINEEFLLEEFEDYDDDDDDDDDFESDLVGTKKMEEWLTTLNHLAHTTSKDIKAISKAQEIFDTMFETFVRTENLSFCPNLEVYNRLLEIYAFSSHKDGGELADHLLSKMEDKEESSSSEDWMPRPNQESYLHVMDAWAVRRNPIQVESVMKRQQKRYEQTKDGEIQPSVEGYNKLIKAYGIVGDVEKAEEIFVSLIDKDLDDPLKANYKSWVQIMKAFASQQDGADKVQSLFREMTKEYRMNKGEGKNEEYKPKTDAYNAVMRALSQKENGGAEEAERLLFDLISRFHTGEDDIRPNADSFRHVLSAQRLRRKKNTISAAKVEQLLQIQEGLYATTKEDDLQLDGRTYNLALYIVSRSRDAKKAIRARRILDKMRELDDSMDQINVRTYFNLLSACAFTVGSPSENLEAFQIAVDGLKELRESRNKKPDSSCYGMFLKACANLMPESRKRDSVVDNVFRKCCTDGLVDDFVLTEFERASSTTLQLEILGGFLEDDVRIPEAWSKNVLKDKASS